MSYEERHIPHYYSCHWEWRGPSWQLKKGKRVFLGNPLVDRQYVQRLKDWWWVEENQESCFKSQLIKVWASAILLVKWMRCQGSHLINYEMPPPLLLSSYTLPLFLPLTCEHVSDKGICRDRNVNLFKSIPVNIILGVLVSCMGVQVIF